MATDAGAGGLCRLGRLPPFVVAWNLRPNAGPGSLRRGRPPPVGRALVVTPMAVGSSPGARLRAPSLGRDETAEGPKVRPEMAPSPPHYLQLNRLVTLQHFYLCVERPHTHTHTHPSNRCLHSFSGRLHTGTPADQVRLLSLSPRFLNQGSSGLQILIPIWSVPRIAEQLPAPGHLHRWLRRAGRLTEATRVMGAETEAPNP